MDLNNQSESMPPAVTISVPIKGEIVARHLQTYHYRI